MAAAKRLRTNPRALAAAVAESFEASAAGVADKVEVAGPGFVNITLSGAFLSGRLGSVGIDQAVDAQRIVLDYSSPNLAKEMHVGHLRTTIGDAMARILEALGHEVIRQNHVGDWGTQFGMLVAHLEDRQESAAELADLEVFYAEARKRFDADPEFADRARQTVVGLQRGEESVRAYWRRFIEISLSHCRSVYDTLGITLTDADLDGRGRTTTTAAVIQGFDGPGLPHRGTRVQSAYSWRVRGAGDRAEGATAGYLYATSDLAGGALRARHYPPTAWSHFTDARQSLHFRQFSPVARRRIRRCGMQSEHHRSEAILGAKPAFKRHGPGRCEARGCARRGRERTRKLVGRKNPVGRRRGPTGVARVDGIGGRGVRGPVGKNRTTLRVSTGTPWLSSTAYRALPCSTPTCGIQSIFRRRHAAGRLKARPPLTEPRERRLAVCCCGYRRRLEQSAREALPHLLCTYLFDLTSRFMAVSTRRVPSGAPARYATAASSCALLTADTRGTGLDLLG